MNTCTVRITLTVAGPVLSRSTQIGAHAVDAPFHRDSNDNLILPSSLVSGRLRQSFEELATIPALRDQFMGTAADLLGTDSGDDGGDSRNGPVAPRRGRVHFTDFMTPTPSPHSSRPRQSTSSDRHRIALDATRGSVKEHHLQTLEAPFPSGVLARFSGLARFIAHDGIEASVIREQIDFGLRWMTNLGGVRTGGFGDLRDVEVEQPIVRRIAAPISSGATAAGTPGALDLEIRPQQPFCFARPRVTLNLYESRDEIPGAAIKGALAEKWRQMLNLPAGTPVAEFRDPERPELVEHFDALVVQDAFPSSTARRPLCPPQSLVRVTTGGADHTYDVALLPKPVLLHDTSPAFAVDWKNHDREAVARLPGYERPELNRKLQVRTKLNAHTRKGEDEKLFAWETVATQAGVVWRGHISFNSITDAVARVAVARQLEGLLADGLPGLSKTKAFALVTPIAAHPPNTPAPLSGDYPWIVTLQTSALLCDPERLQGPATAAQLASAYAEVWHQLSGGGLQLSHFFARQSLAGGRYLHDWFTPDLRYYPWLLTEAGSVFVFRQATNQAAVHLKEWLTSGLPVPHWAVARYGLVGTAADYWMRCPFVPQNGFGEIAVNLSVHTELRPRTEDYDECL